MDPNNHCNSASHHAKCETTRPQTINIDQVLSIHFNEKKKVARRRWAILAKALKNPVDNSYGEPASPTDEYSVRRISSFMLFATTQLDGIQDPTVFAPPTNCDLLYYLKETKRRIWYRYTTYTPNNKECFVLIGHRRRTFSAEDLMGFNNTGNVCVWPSEETLSYFIATNLHLFAGRSVLELGGGMSCLAGLICAKYANCKRVLLTDGNKMSVENVQVSVACNQFRCAVTCQILRWGAPDINHCCQYDAILCADCLFFDEARADLIQSLYEYLAADGVAYVMAPRRGNTLEDFRAQAVEQGFRCLVRENYSAVVWSKHLELLEHNEYDHDIHYPILLELTKVAKADYWKSQTRKYCDFCKCWITDNKPSVEFHEKGRRHQDNVAKRLKNIHKQSERNQRKNINEEVAIAKMEAAALQAYRKDLDNGETDMTASAAITKAITGGKKWLEAISEKGTYYWNTDTNESVWDPPRDGYMTLLEQKAAEEAASHTQWKIYSNKERLQERLRQAEIEKDKEEVRAASAREKMKARRVEPIKPVESGPILPPGKTDPYGSWTTVVEKVSTIDYELPKREEEYIPVEIPEEEPPVREFKTKTVESLGTGSTSFKKRKIISGSKRNVRQRGNDD